MEMQTRNLASLLHQHALRRLYHPRRRPTSSLTSPHLHRSSPLMPLWTICSILLSEGQPFSSDDAIATVYSASLHIGPPDVILPIMVIVTETDDDDHSIYDNRHVRIVGSLHSRPSDSSTMNFLFFLKVAISNVTALPAQYAPSTQDSPIFFVTGGVLRLSHDAEDCAVINVGTLEHPWLVGVVQCSAKRSLKIGGLVSLIANFGKLTKTSDGSQDMLLLRALTSNQVEPLDPETHSHIVVSDSPGDVLVLTRCALKAYAVRLPSPASDHAPDHEAEQIQRSLERIRRMPHFAVRRLPKANSNKPVDTPSEASTSVKENGGVGCGGEVTVKGEVEDTGLEGGSDGRRRKRPRRY